MSILTPEEVQHELRTRLPVCDQHDEKVEAVGDGTLRLRLPFHETFLGRDVWQNTGEAVFSGPMVRDSPIRPCMLACERPMVEML